MARYTDAQCKLCRREGMKLFLKGERCFSSRCPLERKGAVPPGQHGQKRQGRVSDYGWQLREKQKAKRIYGLLERQFKRYFKKAHRQKKGAGLRLLQLLELRLDNVIFRAGLVLSRSAGRQIITHGFCLVDGKKVNLPSYQLKPGQLITLTPKGLALEGVKKALAQKQPLPQWLARKAAVIKIKRLPERKEIEANINEQLIIEFYSR
jgi:small subunit ribosomal protein S4